MMQTFNVGLLIRGSSVDGEIFRGGYAFLCTVMGTRRAPGLSPILPSYVTLRYIEMGCQSGVGLSLANHDLQETKSMNDDSGMGADAT